MIEKINGLTALKNLKILALGRNNIKTFAGIESLADNLEELWISYNDIERMKGVLNMRRLKVLHMSHNKVEDLNEVQNLGKMESLLDFVFVGTRYNIILNKNKNAFTIEFEKKRLMLIFVIRKSVV